MTILQILKEKYPVGSIMTLWTTEPKRGLGRLQFQQSPHFCKEIDLIVKEIVYNSGIEYDKWVGEAYFKILFESGHSLILEEY